MKLKWSLTVFGLLCAGMLISRADQESLQQELAQARAAPAIYHDVDRAIADGYVAPPSTSRAKVFTTPTLP